MKVKILKLDRKFSLKLVESTSTICGQKMYFLSTGSPAGDRRVNERLERVNAERNASLGF